MAVSDATPGAGGKQRNRLVRRRTTRKERGYRAPGRTKVASGDQPIPGGIADQVGIGGDRHLLENASTVGAHRLGRDGQLAGDLRDGEAAAEPTHDFELAIGQQLVRGSLPAAIEMLGQLLRQRRTDVLAAAIHPADGVQQLIRRMVFGEIARGTSPERPYRPLILRVNAQGQDPNGRVAGAQLPQSLEKQAAGHRYVEQHEIGGRGLEPGKQRRGGVRLTRNRHPRVRLHDAAEPLPDDRVVVRDEDANLRRRSGHGFATGIVTAIPVPCPGSPRIISVPPHASARSRMPTNPSDRSPLSDWGVNPTPLSSTPRMMTAPTRRTDTSTRVALECRVTLVSASWMIRKA